jgi:glyoxylase I family protein
MSELKALHHLSFTVPDLQAALGFWQDLLGFQPIPRPDLGFPGAWLHGHGVEVHLLEAAAAVPTDTRLTPIRNHVAFRVDDLEEMKRKLEGAGLEVVSGAFGIRQMFVLDPAANVIEFTQPA